MPAAKILFICSQNRLRSPTAEEIFSRNKTIEVASAGTNHDADTPLSAELIEWADIIYVMERTHRARIQQRFKAALKSKRIICLNIPDNYEFMDPALVKLLESRLPQFVPSKDHVQTWSSLSA